MASDVSSLCGPWRGVVLGLGSGLQDWCPVPLGVSLGGPDPSLSSLPSALLVVDGGGGPHSPRSEASRAAGAAGGETE